VESQAIEPAFVILERGVHFGPFELLVVGGIRLRLETSMDEGALIVIKKWRCIRVVMDKEVGKNGNDYCEKTFLQED
jgi:hypothetical protein